MGIETIIAAVAALGSLAGGAKSLFDRGGKQQIAAPAPAPVPAGPPADLTADQIAAQRGGVPTAPNFLRFGTGMTNQQKRAQIATLGTQGNDSRWADPATKDYYKKLLVSDYDPAKGLAGGILPVERQYAENVLGAKPRADTTESILSAILRG